MGTASFQNRGGGGLALLQHEVQQSSQPNDCTPQTDFNDLNSTKGFAAVTTSSLHARKAQPLIEERPSTIHPSGIS